MMNSIRMTALVAALLFAWLVPASRSFAQADVVVTKMVMKLETTTVRTVAKVDSMLAANQQRVALLRSRGVAESRITPLIDRTEMQADRILDGLRRSIDKIEMGGERALVRFGSPAEPLATLNAAADECHRVTDEAAARVDQAIAEWRAAGG